MSAGLLKDYLNKYTSVCDKKRVKPIEFIRKQLEAAVTMEEPIDEFLLRGSSNAELKYSRIDDNKLESLLSPFQYGGAVSFLRKLDLSYNEIGNKGALLLAKMVKDDTFIEYLSLKSNSIGVIGSEALAKSFSYNTSISYFDFSDNTLGEEGGMALASTLQVNTTLETLLISGCGLPSTAMIAIVSVLQSNNQIEILDISNNLLKTSNLTQSLVNNVMTHFSQTFKTNYGIKALYLSKLGITDWIMCDFLAKSIGDNENIVTLDLSCCALQDEGAEAISNFLAVNRKIRSLHLDYNKITGIGLVSIAKGIRTNVSLKYVGLWGNSWNNDACEEFAELIGGNFTEVKIGAPKVSAPQTPKSYGRLGPFGVDVTFNRVEGVLKVAKTPTMGPIDVRNW